jgi:cytochrome c oxidase subunit 2
MMSRYIEAVSTFAGQIDQLVWFIAILVGFWTVLCYAVFFGFLFRFRRGAAARADYVTGEEKHLKRWVTIPHMLVLVCDVFIIFGAVRVWHHIKQEQPPAQQTVRVVSQQWAWTFVHPGPDKTLDTADDITTINELHVQTDTFYHFLLESKDVLHNFSVPVFRLKQDAVPGRVITGWFKAEKTGEWDIQCAEICGIGHGLMGARIHVESAEQHAAWIAEHAQPTSVALATAR